MAQIYCYALVNQNNNLIITDSKLPIYWNRSVAKDKARDFKCDIVRIEMKDIKVLID